MSGTTTQLTTNPAPQLDPAISASLVVYTDQRNGNDDVYYVDVDTLAEVQVTSANSAQRLNDIDGATIVFTDLTAPNRRVFAYDTGSAMSLQVGTGTADQNPRIDGNVVVFERGPVGATDVVAFDLASATEIVVAATAASELSPSINGTRVAFERRATGSSPSEIVVFDLASATETTLTSSTADDRRPDIDGDIVVWDFTTGAGDTDIAIHDLATSVTKVLALAGNQRSPHVSGHTIAFDDDSAGNANIMLHDLDTATTSLVTTSAAVEFLNDIDGDRIAFTSNASGNNDIWMFTIERDTGCTDPSTDLCASADGFDVRAAATFERAHGRPFEETVSFSAEAGPAALIVHNNGCSSATGSLNGTPVLFPADLNQQVTCFVRQVEVGADNALTVEVRSAPGCSLDIEVAQLAEGSCEPDEVPSCAQGGLAGVAPLAALAFLAPRRRRRK